MTFLIRTSWRPEAFNRCINSIEKFAPYSNIIVSYDNVCAVSYIPVWFDKIKVEKSHEPFFYNLYLNDLLDAADEPGHIIFIDDDDYLIHSLPEFEAGKSYIAPFMRGSFQKPTAIQIKRKIISRGYIGLPSLVLWWSHKHHVNFIADEYADFTAIKNLSEKVNLTFLNTPLIKSEKRNFGVTESLDVR